MRSSRDHPNSRWYTLSPRTLQSRGAAPTYGMTAPSAHVVLSTATPPNGAYSWKEQESIRQISAARQIDIRMRNWLTGKPPAKS